MKREKEAGVRVNECESEEWKTNEVEETGSSGAPETGSLPPATGAAPTEKDARDVVATQAGMGRTLIVRGGSEAADAAAALEAPLAHVVL